MPINTQSLCTHKLRGCTHARCCMRVHATCAHTRAMSCVLCSVVSACLFESAGMHLFCIHVTKSFRGTLPINMW